ncbi:MAG: glycoside hydrolase family 28 protein [Pirellulales bacterium]|nr:glycoside hydrolase family 28 protein [Pirellulales bacterium]
MLFYSKLVSFQKVLVLGLCFYLMLASISRGAQSVDIRELGAKGDGVTMCTKAIQEAIDRCAETGGGTVRLPSGTWLCGTLYMKNNVTLWLDGGCVLLGSKELADYPKNIPATRSWTDRYVNRSLIAGEGLKNIAIRGRGTIDGNGSAFPMKEYLIRPYIIRLVKCRDVLVEGIRLQSSPMWMQHYLACDRLTLRGLTVFNHVACNNDGIDVDGCSDVCISDCFIDSDDDAITLKSTLGRPCENVAITNCVASSHCNAIKMGTESHGGFKNITISNCAVCSPRYSKCKYGTQRGLAGIALEIVDGGHLDRVAIDNIAIRGVGVPIFLRLGNRARIFTDGIPKPDVGTFRNVSINNIVATDVDKIGCAICGIPGHRIENVSLSNIQITFEGGGNVEQTRRNIPENEEKYPESKMFGPLPAYGFYCRHVKGITMSNIRLRTTKPDQRHALVCDDVQNAGIAGLDAQFAPGAEAVIGLKQVQDAAVRGCQAATPVDTFLKIEGDKCSNVTVLSNNLAKVKKVVALGPNVPEKTLAVIGNRMPDSQSGR